MIQDNTNYFNMNDFVGKNADVNTIDKFDFHSFYRAYVVDNQDNEKLGRVKIRIPALHENSTTYPWAYPATLTGFGFQTGMFILPPVGSLVWVTFEYSDEHRPIYFGGIPTTYADGKYQSYGPYINGNNPVRVTGNDIPFEYTGSQQIIYKSPKGSILYFDNGEINDLIVMKNVYGQGMEVGAIYDSDTGDYDRYTKMIYDDDNYVQINEGEFHLILDGEDITLEPSTFNSYNELTNKPQINNVTLQGNKSWQDLGLPSIPTKVSDLENDTGFITKTVNNLTNYYLKTDTYTKTEVNNLIAQINSFNVEIVQVLPTTNIDTHTIYLVPKEGSTQDIYNEYLYVNSNWELLGTTEIDLTNYYTKTEVNTLLASKANISDVPPKMSILSYGSSTWNDFITAYNSKSIVYCRASSNSNPATGSQTRLAFMAYVNNAESPTQVEFQYYRSVNAHSITQQGDQVYVYLLKNNNTWSVTTRETMANIDASDGLTRSYSGNKLTISGAGKQDTLVSGTNIKTINNESILGSGDITISGNESYFTLDTTEHPNNNLVLRGLKKGIYLWKDGYNVFNLKLDTSNTEYLTFNTINRVIYVLQDITDSLPNNTPIVAVPQFTQSATTIKSLVLTINTNQASGLLNSSDMEIHYVNSTGNQTINGVKTFNSLPLCSVVPTGSTQLVNKQYVDANDIAFDPIPSNVYLDSIEPGIYFSTFASVSFYQSEGSSQLCYLSGVYNFVVFETLSSSTERGKTFALVYYTGSNRGELLNTAFYLTSEGQLSRTNAVISYLISPLANHTTSVPGKMNFGKVPQLDPNQSLTPVYSYDLVNKQYVDDSIAACSSSFHVLDPDDYPTRIIDVDGLKAGIYIWKDLFTEFKLRLDNTYSSTLSAKPFNRVIYILQDITSSLASTEKVIYMPDSQNSVSAPYNLYEFYITVDSTTSSGLKGYNSRTWACVMANNGYDQTIDGVKTFSSLPISNNTPTSSTQLVNKQYVDDCIANSITNVLGGSI